MTWSIMNPHENCRNSLNAIGGRLPWSPPMASTPNWCLCHDSFMGFWHEFYHFHLAMYELRYQAKWSQQYHPKRCLCPIQVLDCKLLRPQGSFEGSTTLSVLNWAFARIELLDPQFFSYPQRSCFIACKEFHEHSSHKEIRKFAMDNQVQNGVVQLKQSDPIYNKNLEFWVGTSFFLSSIMRIGAAIES